ncbi:MAG TPA: RluA family pseudouridine synthase [Candidatus Dojkabacteria bacterium]|nr:RluA family pseudouridine synthase [Candidatus Dojkabacteria bacterium]
MKITDENIGKRADVFVKEKLEKNALSRTFIAENLVKFFKVNDREVKPSYKFKKGDTYSIDYENLKRLVSNLTNEESLIAQKKDLDIIYEDENCLVINKESGIVVHPGSGNKQNTLANYVKGYLEAKGEFDSKVKRGGVIHRLDKGVSGLILFAKNEKAQRYFQNQFENHLVQKVYYAQIEYNQRDNSQLLQYIPKNNLNLKSEIGKLKKNKFICDDQWLKVEGYIKRSETNRMKMKFTKYFRNGAKYSLTYIKPISENELIIKIETGRMHQIRAVLEYFGVNIKGDTLYSTKTGKGGIPEKICLTSILLSIKNLDGNILTISLI